jgi:hypothetical protein
VSDKSVPLTCSVHRAVPVFRGALAKYGHRAHAAETNQGIDWKAVMHAVRVGTQTIELLETGTITFPRPDATFLLTVVKGEHPYREVAARIESLMTEVEEAAARSPLPEKPDFAMMDLLVANAYQEEARKASVHDLALERRTSPVQGTTRDSGAPLSVAATTGNEASPTGMRITTSISAWPTPWDGTGIKPTSGNSWIKPRWPGSPRRWPSDGRKRPKPSGGRAPSCRSRPSRCRYPEGKDPMSPSFLKRLAYRIAYCIGCRQAAGIYRHSCARVVRRKTEHQYALETAPLIEPELPLLVREFVAMLPPQLQASLWVREHPGYELRGYRCVMGDPGMDG